MATVSDFEECTWSEFSAKDVLEDVEVVSNRLQVLGPLILLPLILHTFQWYQHCANGRT